MGTIKLGSSSSASRAINYAEKRAVVKDSHNCDIDYAKSQFKQMRALYDKNDGIQAHTIIQSFPPGEVTPEQANALGVELAKRVAPTYQVAVYTHDDKEHIHNHIIINSVDVETGKKFVNQKKTIYEVREKNDAICRENGLSVVEKKSAPIRYTLAEQALVDKEKVTWKDTVREAIEDSMQDTSVSSFDTLKDKLKNEYQIDMKMRGKTITYALKFNKGDEENPEFVERKVRASKLGETYDKGGLEHGFEQNEKTRRTAERTAEKLRGIKAIEPTRDVAAGKFVQPDEGRIGELASSNIDIGTRRNTKRNNNDKSESRSDESSNTRTKTRTNTKNTTLDESTDKVAQQLRAIQERKRKLEEREQEQRERERIKQQNEQAERKRKDAERARIREQNRQKRKGRGGPSLG